MPWIAGSLPFAASPFPLPGHTSYKGAKDAEARSATQTLRYMRALIEYGPLTDADAARLMCVERTTVNARRNTLMKQGIVVAIDSIKGRYGVSNTRWGIKR